jgi:intraflagellar transport protein 80
LNDFFAVGFVDGSFRLISKLGKSEKTVLEAHKGALIALKWSSDGYSLVTAGEDGSIKIWSKSGNLRSSFVQMETPIYCLCWSPDND